jgi:hypothetical protein
MSKKKLDRDAKFLIVGVLVGVTFSLLGQALYQILFSDVSRALPLAWQSYAPLIAAVPPAALFFILAIVTLKRL